jgi:hypothetical protein
VKNFEPADFHKKTRGWRGISLHHPSLDDPSEGSASVQNPSKHKGGETLRRHFEENFQNLSTDTASYRGFSKNDEQVPPVPPSASEPSPPSSEDDYLEGPATFERDGLTVEYIRERSE